MVAKLILSSTLNKQTCNARATGVTGNFLSYSVKHNRQHAHDHAFSRQSLQSIALRFVTY